MFPSTHQWYLENIGVVCTDGLSGPRQHFAELLNLRSVYLVAGGSGGGGG